ncbi:MAG: DUF4405 domain-containing protein [Candidatus Heteroscillospira sp.]|jgi:hypothetical protein
MKPKAVLKLLTDILMTLALMVLMGFQFWGAKAHEWAGVGLLALFLLHHFLNGRWHRNLFQGNYTYLRICGAIVNILLFIVTLLLAYSSIVISRYVFDFLEISVGMSKARRIHIQASYWGFILMGAHLGLHWCMILGMVKKPKRNKLIPSFAPSLLGALTAAYGAYVFIKRNFLTYMLLKSEFVFMDYSEQPLLFYLDYLALLGLFVFIFHYLGKILRKNRASKKPEATP